MATNYPGALDTLTNPIGTDALNSATVPHAQQHANANDAIEAIQAELGVNPKGSSATVVARLDGTANLGAANAFTVGGHTITAQSAAIIPLRINGAASQSGNLLELRNSGGTLLASFTSVGTLLMPAASLRIGTSIANTSFAVNNDTASTTTVVAVIRGIASQSANLQEWQQSDGTILSRIGSSGLARIGGSNGVGTGITSTTLGVGSIDPTWIALTVKGSASQSANLQEWQNSSGTLLTNITASGQFVNTVSIANNDYGNRTNFGNARLQLLTTGATFTTSVDANVALKVQNTNATPTANLQEWLNTGGTALATMSSTGVLRSTGINTNTDLATLTEENSGGRLRLTRMTSAAANPSANQAKIYLRDGTTAGTLKLVIRAGAAGAETTILDNIPQ
jgi:hypothetical protein